MQYASALKVPSVNILAGKQPLDADLLPCLNTLSKNLKLACHMFSEHDIQPVFEMINGTDMPRFLVQNIAQAQEMLEAVQHPALKMQYDCYHMAMMGEDVLQGLQENIQAIGHIQFADCPGGMSQILHKLCMQIFLNGYNTAVMTVLLRLNIDQKLFQLSPLHGRQNTLLHILKVEPLRI